MQNDGGFERIQVNVGVRSVAITSWFDRDSGTWRANAPGLGHVLEDSQQGQIVGDTRQKAIDGVKRCLERQLNADDKGEIRRDRPPLAVPRRSNMK